MSKHIRNTTTAPAMTREEYNDLPAAVRYFIPWERARRPLTVKRVGPPAKATRNPEGYKHFTEANR
jgi:hypothetical protein